jgi:hypothetical protein
MTAPSMTTEREGEIVTDEMLKAGGDLLKGFTDEQGPHSKALAVYKTMRSLAPVAHPTGDAEGLVERLRFDAARCEATYSKGIASNIEEAIAALVAANSRLAATEKSNVELSVLAHKWMEAHDKLKAGEPYSFPSPADVPALVRRAEAAEARVAVLEKALEPFAELAGGFDAHIYNDEKWPLLFKDEDHPVDDRGPTIGDLRRARAALSTGAGEKKR